MSYQVFARKYRPQSFEDVVAQEHITKTLQNSISHDRLGSGYLFCGPRGTGKTTTARILAKAVNCEQGPTATPCNECATCKEITASSSLDVLEIDAASNTGVDDIRTLRENVRYLPTSGKKRIYIIDEVHRLSPSAFDALLKTLEEPPSHVLFIFATTEPLKVPETILSRTQRFDFKLVSTENLANHLKFISQSEKVTITENAVRMVARKANGSVRDSLSLLDQVVAYAGNLVNEETVAEALGLVDKSLLFEFTEAIAAKKKKEVLGLVKTVFDNGVDPRDFTIELLEHFRVLMILGTDKESASLLDLTDSEMTEYIKQVDYYSVGDMVRLMKIATDLNRDLKLSGLDERLLLELAAVKMAELEATITFEEVLTQLQSAPQNTGDSDLFASTQKKKPEPTSERLTLKRPLPEEKSAETVPQSKPLQSRAINLPLILDGWKQFLTVFQQKKPMLAAQMGMVTVSSVKDNKLTLALPTSGETAKLILEKPDNINIITQALSEHYKAQVSITYVIDAAIQSPVIDVEKKQKKQLELRKKIEQSPRIKQLIEKVDGRIIGIKEVEN